MEVKTAAKPPFEAVVEGNADRVYALACRLLGGVKGAEELVQESFTRAYRFYGTLAPETRVDAWLYRITIITWKKRDKQSGAQNGVQAALAKLAHQDKALVTLRDIEGKSYAMMARIFLVPEKTVKTRLSRARRSLKQILEDNNETR